MHSKKTILIRKELPTDVAAIEAVTVAAFLNAKHTSHTEQFILNALRQAGQLSISLVADENSTVVGHVAVSPVAISDGTVGWYCLGPVSVVPERQGQSIGGQLVAHALTVLRRLGAAGCVVLGDPAYYSRFGFNAEPSLVLPDVPPEYFQAIAFTDLVPAGTVAYHESFAAQD